MQWSTCLFHYCELWKPSGSMDEPQAVTSNQNPQDKWWKVQSTCISVPLPVWNYAEKVLPEDRLDVWDMDSGSDVTSASSTVIDMVALAPWPLLWFCRIAAMPSHLTKEPRPTTLGFGPGEQWHEHCSAQSPAEAHSVSLNHHIPVIRWKGTLFHLSFHFTDWTVRSVIVNATIFLGDL